MKNRVFIILWLVSLFAVQAFAGNAPVVKAGNVLNAPVSPAITSIPVTVCNFIDIGSLTLTFDYSPSVITYVGFSPNPAFQGLTVTMTAPGRIVINWPPSGTGITLPDQSQLLSVQFAYNSGGNTSMLSWYDNGTSCQFTRYSAGTYPVLDDQPAASYYLGGVITNHAAPVVSAPVITNATAGQIAVPVRVKRFTNIGAITLKLEYDPGVLTYQSFAQNTLIPGSFDVGNNPGQAGKKNIDMLWFGPSFGLADSSILITLYFTFSNTAGSCDYSMLTWIENGPSCEFTDGQYRVLYDQPSSSFLKNGVVSGRPGLQVWLPYVTNASSTEYVFIPVQVNNFTNIKSFVLTFEYDPAVMTYNSYTPCEFFGNMLTVSDNPGGTGGRKVIVLTWSGMTSLSLPEASSIATLKFTYLSGVSQLSWETSDATSCRFADSAGNSCYDLPKSSCYQNGLVGSHLTPSAAAWHASPETGQQVTVPVKVYSFSGIGLFSLTLDYDPGVVTYTGATLVPSIGGTFTASCPGPGRIVFGWSGPPCFVEDNGNLINISFTYNCGNTQLSWYDDGNSCRYAESPAADPLFDQPFQKHYVNGHIGSNQTATWIGSISSDWNTAANWDIDIVPGSATDVVIPGSVSNWPVFSGDFIPGFFCKTLTLSSIFSKLSINGNLVIRQE